MNDKDSKSKRHNKTILIILVAIMSFNVILLFSLTHTISNMRRLNAIIINNKYDISKTKVPIKPVIVYKDKIIYRDKVVKEKCDSKKSDNSNSVDIVESIIHDHSQFSVHRYMYYYTKLTRSYYIVNGRIERIKSGLSKASSNLEKLNYFSDSLNLIKLDLKIKADKNVIKNDIDIIYNINKSITK